MTGAGRLSLNPSRDPVCTLPVETVRRPNKALWAAEVGRLRTVRTMRRFPTKVMMKRLTDQIMNHAQGSPKGSRLLPRARFISALARRLTERFLGWLLEADPFAPVEASIFVRS